MGREILVIKRDILFKDGFFSGFISFNDDEQADAILKNAEYQERNDALEHDVRYKQIIPYIWILNSETKKVFVYRRASDENYNEERLRNKWSGGIGGHVDKNTEEHAENPLLAGMMRELQEEVTMEAYLIPKLVGLVTLDNKMIEHYHVGFVHILETTQPVAKKDKEIAEGLFKSIAEVDALFADSNNQVELFTQLSWPFVKGYLLSI